MAQQTLVTLNVHTEDCEAHTLLGTVIWLFILTSVLF
jgi:hypothetical protein